MPDTFSLPVDTYSSYPHTRPWTPDGRLVYARVEPRRTVTSSKPTSPARPSASSP